MRLLHQHFEFLKAVFTLAVTFLVAQALVVTADNLLFRSLAAHLVIDNAVACHIHAHIGRAFVRTFAVNHFKHCI